MRGTLYQKVWDLHRVRRLPDGRDQLYVGLHLVHEVTSPQAFAMLDELGVPVAEPDRTVATVDHILPTLAGERAHPLADPLADAMMAALRASCERHAIRLLAPGSGRQGIVHVVGPELGLTQPGMTICCGDSHTSTHGAFGAIAFGIGTTQVRDVLATQTLAMSPLAVTRIQLDGVLRPGVYAKDVILHVIRALGVGAGVGQAWELAGTAVDAMSMEARMTLCNMAIEAGARVGYCNPDETTVAYLRGREHAPPGEDFDRAAAWWRSLASEPEASYDAVHRFDVSAVEPVVTWGTNPAEAVAVDEPAPDTGRPMTDTAIDVAFIGSCTNGRLSDLRAAAEVLRGRRVHERVRALVVPGSEQVARAAQAEGLDAVFRAAGFEWRAPGCSMCLGMNPDRLVGAQVCASSSNRNFKGRQGSPTGRTLLMSPAMVAAAAVTGRVADARALPSVVEAA